MSVYQASNIQSLREFSKTENQLAVLERCPLKGADKFFNKLMQSDFSLIGQAFKDSSLEDIKFILEEDIPKELQSDPFYPLWVADIASLCKVFCDVLVTESVSLQLSTKRGCRRYHVDNVPMRMLVTYAGKGTEWISDEVVDRQAYESGKTNEEILKDLTETQYMNIWDVAIFRGGKKGLLHRTPDAALMGPSVLLRLDHENFWDDILKDS